MDRASIIARPTVLLVLAILVFFMGCITMPETQNAPGTVWLEKTVSACPQEWDVWHTALNRTYIRAPTQEEILTEYLRETKGIAVQEYIEHVSDELNCTTCACMGQGTVRILVNITDSGVLVVEGWSLIKR